MSGSLIIVLLGVNVLLHCSAFHVRLLSDPVILTGLSRQRLNTLQMAQTEQKPKSYPDRKPRAATTTASISTESSTVRRPVDIRTRQASNSSASTSSQPPRPSLGDEIKKLGDAREWEQAKALFHRKVTPTAVEFSAIIYAARVCKECSSGMLYYEMMVKELSQLSVNLYIYDNLISMNLDYGDDERALKVFSDLLSAETVKKARQVASKTAPVKLTGASQISLEKCIFNALRASLNIQFQNKKIEDSKGAVLIQNTDESDTIVAEGSDVTPAPILKNEVDFFDVSAPSRNTMEETISSILGQNWKFIPKDKSLIVRAYASWNMTAQLAEMSDFIFQDPLPDMWTLETYMNSMLETYPELALLSLQWYLPIINTESPVSGDKRESSSSSSPLGTDTILSGIISNTIMTEKRKGRNLASYENTEPVSARCLGVAVKALARLDYFVGNKYFNCALRVI